MQPLPRHISSYVKGTSLGIPPKRNSRIVLEPSRLSEVELVCCQIRMNSDNRLSIQHGFQLPTVRQIPKADLRNTHGRTFQDPRFVGPGCEYRFLLHDVIQQSSVATFPDRIGRDQSGPAYPAFCQLLGRLGEPIADQVGASRDPILTRVGKAPIRIFVQAWSYPVGGSTRCISSGGSGPGRGCSQTRAQA